MSHIPAAAMPHAKPHETAMETPVTQSSGRPDWGLVAAVAGGVVALGAVAAAAVPLLRGRAAPKRARRERKARRSARESAAK